MAQEEILQKVCSIVSEQLSVESAEVKSDSNFQNDLGADSLDTVELVMALEEAFDTLLNLRLQERLRYFEHGEDPDNHIDIKNLNQLELELLKDSLKIVNKFKDVLKHHFKINLVQ